MPVNLTDPADIPGAPPPAPTLGPMSDTDPAPLLSPTEGLAADDARYPDTVTAVLRAAGYAVDPTGRNPHEHVQLAARTADALNEVAHWAGDGQAADPTACAWLSYLRWAREQGARLPSDAPVLVPRDFDRQFTVLTAPAAHPGDSFPALATGRLGEVTRPVAPTADSSEVVSRSIPFGLLPHLGWQALLPLVIDAAAITHGDPEAQVAAAGAALAVHASARAARTGAGMDRVVTEVAAVLGGVTRPAPRTLALLRALAEAAGRGEAAVGEAARAIEDRTAPSALALGLAAALQAAATADIATAELTQRALRAVAEHPRQSPAARVVAAAVTAARRGTAALPEAGGPASGELGELAAQWMRCWCP